MTQIINKHCKPYYWLFDQQVFNTISEQQFHPSYWQATNAIIGKESGRGTTWFIAYEGYELVLRHYLRGGVMRHISHDQYFFSGLDKTRAFAEFSILHLLVQKNLPVPKPAAAQVIKKGLVYRADLLTHKIPNAQDLVSVLKVPQPADFYISLGKVIASFHQQGIFHADLNIQNILQDNTGKFWLIDFDRARILQPNERWQAANIARLKRSFEKEVGRFGIHWTEKDWSALMHGYQSDL